MVTELPDNLLRNYMNILITGAATHTPHSDDLQLRIRGLYIILYKLMNKHLSDSPDVSDKKRFICELLETSLKLAKGEMKCEE